MPFLTPEQIVGELDRYIIGQDKAKRAVAIALRNRWRRQQIPPPLKDEVLPKNIIMIGPTGVGKTEIARRLARLVQSPFIKIEATKFTEVGYVGRDVESIIRDLVEIAVNVVKSEEHKKVVKKARELAEERLLDMLLPKRSSSKKPEGSHLELVNQEGDSTRQKLRQMLHEKKLDNRYVELRTAQRAFPAVEVFSIAGLEELDMNVREMFESMLPKKTTKRRVKVPEALRLLTQEESQKLVDMDRVISAAKKRAEESGIVFLDEIDKITAQGRGVGPDVSREGVQRDLLPIVEGTTVNTRYGPVNTDHILFIASGAFHTSKPSDLVPEIQGRFPIRVELNSLDKGDFIRILTEPENALVKQYQALLKTERIDLEFRPEAIEKIADLAVSVNERTENIGARRLYTVMEKLLENISFNAPQTKGKIIITEKYVQEELANIIADEDLTRYIL